MRRPFRPIIKNIEIFDNSIERRYIGRVHRGRYGGHLVGEEVANGAAGSTGGPAGCREAREWAIPPGN